MSAPGDARLDLFLPGADVPTRRATLAEPGLGASGRNLAEALFDGDLGRAAALLDADPVLVDAPIGAGHVMLDVAIATARPAALDLLIARGAGLDGRGDGSPLRLALHATGPEAAHQLLSAGASPTPTGDPIGPFRAAILANSAGAMRMLLDFRADPDAMDASGRRPLHVALDVEHFRLAELLLDAGADIWAIDATGANLGTSVTKPAMRDDPDELAARHRLSVRAARLGWPDPAPTPQAILAAAIEGRWPPVADARPLPSPVLTAIAERMRGTAPLN